MMLGYVDSAISRVLLQLLRLNLSLRSCIQRLVIACTL